MDQALDVTVIGAGNIGATLARHQSHGRGVAAPHGRLGPPRARRTAFRLLDG